jgi:hypothetical protein
MTDRKLEYRYPWGAAALQPGEERDCLGLWSKRQLETMDERFRAAVVRDRPRSERPKENE